MGEETLGGTGMKEGTRDYLTCTLGVGLDAAEAIVEAVDGIGLILLHEKKKELFSGDHPGDPVDHHASLSDLAAQGFHRNDRWSILAGMLEKLSGLDGNVGVDVPLIPVGMGFQDDAGHDGVGFFCQLRKAHRDDARGTYGAAIKKK